MISSFGLDKTFLASLFNGTAVLTKRSKFVLQEVHGEWVDCGLWTVDCGAGHHRQEGGEPGRAGYKGHT